MYINKLETDRLRTCNWYALRGFGQILYPMFLLFSDHPWKIRNICDVFDMTPLQSGGYCTIYQICPKSDTFIFQNVIGTNFTFELILKILKLMQYKTNVSSLIHTEKKVDVTAALKKCYWVNNGPWYIPRIFLQQFLFMMSTLVTLLIFCL